MNNNQTIPNEQQILKLNKQLKTRKHEGRIGLIIIIIIAVLLSYWIRQGLEKGIILHKPQSEYQAVFLSNNQVYFGKITNQNQAEVILSDIYYFTTLRSLQYGEDKNQLPDTPQMSPDTFSLVKLGQELHGPKDEMRINRNHILFIEDLKEDSKVLKAIKDYKETKEQKN